MVYISLAYLFYSALCLKQHTRFFVSSSWHASVLILQCGTSWISLLGFLSTYTCQAEHGVYNERFIYFGMFSDSNICRCWICLYMLLIPTYFILNFFVIVQCHLLWGCHFWLQVDTKCQEELKKLDDLLGPPMSIPLIGLPSYKQMVYMQIVLWKLYISISTLVA